MDVPQRFLKLILTRRYQLTDHVIESMEEDNLVFNDILACLASGHRRRSWPRQQKYEVEGRSTSGRLIRVVGRLIGAQILRIITVYEVE